jgi:hypothetical protein
MEESVTTHPSKTYVEEQLNEGKKNDPSHIEVGHQSQLVPEQYCDAIAKQSENRECDGGDKRQFEDEGFDRRPT